MSAWVSMTKTPYGREDKESSILTPAPLAQKFASVDVRVVVRGEDAIYERQGMFPN